MSNDCVESKGNSGENKVRLTRTEYSVYAALLTTIVTLILYIMSNNGSATNEINRKIQPLNDELLKLIKNNESINRRLIEQSIYIDNLNNNVLFIYSHADLSSTEQWRKSLIEHKNKAEKDLSILQ